MKIIYNIIISLYTLLLLLASPFNRKAALWCRGRKGFFSHWKNFDPGGRKVIWFHCASLGEFEQGRPVIEEVKKIMPQAFVLLTFFSPSGYEIRKNYSRADAVCYLPSDTPANARRFVDTFNPHKVVFVKYEFWHNYISALYEKNIPLYLISANFRPGQIFFKWYGGWFRNMLGMFSHIFVQSSSSKELLSSAGITNVSVSGDTRFDRVFALSATTPDIPVAAAFADSRFTVVAGSTWPPDNSLWIRYMNETGNELKLIIAPHEINEYAINALAGSFKDPVARFSKIEKSGCSQMRILIIDNIGMLSSLYFYGDLAYLGGGFGKGIHNILEASAWGVPVLFGPNYKNFREAVELIELGGVFPVFDYDHFKDKVDQLVVDNNALSRAGEISSGYVRSGTGATRMIADRILVFPEPM